MNCSILEEESYKDSTADFINKLEDLNAKSLFPEGTMTLHVSWDVVSMFPNIDNN